MIILGIDTSTDYAVFFLSDENGQCYGSVSERHNRELSSRFYEMLDALLASVEFSLAQIDAFAVGLGPGSFTGVRIAVTTARTLAQVTGKPLVGVPTMAVYARAARLLCPSATHAEQRQPSVAVLLPSRRNEVYALTDDGRSPAAASAASYAEARESVLRLPPGSCVTGPASLLTVLLEDGEGVGTRRVPQDAPDPMAFAMLAAKALRDGRVQDPLSLDPMYVAPPAVSQHKTTLAGP